MCSILSCYSCAITGDKAQLAIVGIEQITQCVIVIVVIEQSLTRTGDCYSLNRTDSANRQKIRQ